MQKSFLLALPLLFSVPAYGELSMGDTNLSNVTVKSINTLGVATLSKVKTEEVSVTGPLTFKDLSVVHDGTITGSVKGINGQFENLTITGPFTFEGVSVHKDATLTGPVSGSKGYFGDLTVSGPFNATEILCQNLNVTGPVDVTKLAVRDKTVAVGNFTANDSDFGDMTLTANKTLFNKTTARTLLIKKNSEVKSSFLSWFGDNSDENAQELRLTNKSIIEGTVTFESGKGKIFLEEGSKIKGEIQGGVVQKN